MTTKAAPAVTPTVAQAVVKPFSINLIGPAYVIFQELCAHVRNGYVINKDVPVELYQNGHASAMLILGNPDQLAIDQAKESVDLAVQLAEAKYQREVKEAAKAMMEQAKRDALAAQITALKAQQAKDLAAMERANAAALAAL